ncbi:glycerophosphodiester phosphodiesterase [Pumilibacter intestinalis]|uniref:glycerophosphodiester phosphodiesterase n=1 Tax=Pumilibacter intestinalis TaxID=2941511 RepID=UPI00203C16EF|nr:glycerophosphodiester phosphodiesterase family protein [Pumilibacter intestinalis]
MKNTKNFMCALLVCALTLAVIGIGASAKNAYAQNDSGNSALVSVYKNENVKMINAPTVVCDVTGKAVLDNITASQRKPSNAVLSLNEQLHVTGLSGEDLGALADVLAAFDGKIIPVLKVNSQAAANALSEFLKENPEMLDLAVMSETPDLVKYVREQNAKVRGIVEYSEDAFRQNTQDELYGVVSATNSSFANVAIIPQSAASVDNVRYIQARFKTVWVRARNNSAMDVYDCVGSGAYGVVSEDFNAVYDVLESYGNDTMSRMPFNAAHRTLPETHNENSVSGVKAAIAAGATHLEIDGHICKADKNGNREIVIMHDSTLDRTTNGTGAIANMTLDEIRRYKLDEFGEEEIPTFTDVINAMDGSNAVLIFEIKTNDLAIVPLLKQKLTELNAWNKVVVISFYTAILQEMKNVLPQVPTANLNTASMATLTESLEWMGLYNTGVDTTHPNASAEFNAALRDRGIIGWYWTYANAAEMQRDTKIGYTGLTTNRADAYRNAVITVKGKETEKATVRAGDKVRVITTTYAGAQREISGTVIAVEEKDDCYKVVAYYGDIVNLVTQSFVITKPASSEKPDTPKPPEPVVPDTPEPPDEETPAPDGGANPPAEQTPDGGCGGDLATSGTVAAFALLAVAALLLKKRPACSRIN